MIILNRKNWIIFLLTGFVVAFILVGFRTTLTAQASIEDAMKDLGCNTLKSCDTFCDLPENNSSDKCNSYFVFQEQRSDLENVMTFGLDYCASTEECNTYCETHGDLDCRTYYGLQKDSAGLGKLIEKLRQAKQALLAGGGPGGCNSDDSCLLYCGTHYEECQAFTIDGFDIPHATPSSISGLIQGVVSLKTALENKIPLPAVCQKDYIGYMGCLSYCTQESPKPDCVRYMKDTGFLSPTDAAILDLKIQGKTPGAGNPRYSNGCGSLSSCEYYCRERSHVNECLAFAEKYGLTLSPADLITYRKIAPFIKDNQTPDFGPHHGDSGCTSVGMCRATCDLPENYTQCAEFAKKAGLIEEQADIPPEKQAALDAIKKGDAPGGCKDEVSCRAYCDNIANIEECVTFVEKFNLATTDELKEMRQMVSAKESGTSFPGGCTTRESCLKYCENSAHQVECMEFAQQAGFIPEEDAEAVSKILPYLKSGGKLPGGCTTKDLCDKYCESDTNINECMDFAVGAGFMTKEESDIVKKVGGKGPGDCRSREACDNYCKSENHVDECMDFAVKAGFISQEEAEMAKKFGITSGGPGGCKSKAECQSFCTVKENQEMCSNWAKEHGMDMSAGGPGGQAGPGGCKTQEECMAYCKDHQEECQKFAPPDGGAGFNGPGGCKTQEECMAYCKDHQEECQKFAPPGGSRDQPQTLPSSGGGFSPPSGDSGTSFSGPGGCKTQEECMAYCKDHMEECQKFAPPSGGGGASQIPQGYSSWEEFCKANMSDSRCTAYQTQMPPPSGDSSSPPPSSDGTSFSGPGGCKTQEECMTYCTQNYQDPDCQKFGPSSSIEPVDQGFFAGVLSVFRLLFGIQ